MPHNNSRNIPAANLRLIQTTISRALVNSEALRETPSDYMQAYHKGKRDAYLTLAKDIATALPLPTVDNRAN